MADSRLMANLKGKGNPDLPLHWFVQAIGLLSWLSVWVLTIWYFHPSCNTGLQSLRVLPVP